MEEPDNDLPPEVPSIITPWLWTVDDWIVYGAVLVVGYILLAGMCAVVVGL